MFIYKNFTVMFIYKNTRGSGSLIKIIFKIVSKKYPTYLENNKENF